MAETGDEFSSKSAERLTDLSLAVVYIPLPRLRMRSAHVFRRRGLQQKFSYFFENMDTGCSMVQLRYLSIVCRPRFLVDIYIYILVYL